MKASMDRVLGVCYIMCNNDLDKRGQGESVAFSPCKLPLCNSGGACRNNKQSKVMIHEDNKKGER